MKNEEYDFAIKKLEEKFIEIKEKGWIKGVGRGTSNAGDTFEFYLGKEKENFPIADFYGIEIKTRSATNPKTAINLFTSIPYGSDFFEIKRILDVYGVFDDKRPGMKKFNGEVYATFYKHMYANDYKFKLKVDYIEKKLKLLAYNEKINEIDESSYWPFEIIEQKINNKLKCLALVKVKKKKENFEDYFMYESLKIYKFKGISRFFELIEKGYISVCFCIGGFYNEKFSHRIHDHGTSFRIKESDIEKLFIKYKEL